MLWLISVLYECATVLKGLILNQQQCDKKKIIYMGVSVIFHGFMWHMWLILYMETETATTIHLT